MYTDFDDEDLRSQIYHLKKQLAKITSENYLLKVKVRKLQNEVHKKDKQMDTVILDPRQSSASTAARKILFEHSASFILSLKEKNDNLEQEVLEKNLIIKRLHNNLEIMKLYSQQLPKKFYETKIDNKLKDNKSTSCLFRKTKVGRSKNRSSSWAPGISDVEATLIENIKFDEEEEEKQSEEKKTDLKEQYKSLSKEHLLSIIENLKTQRNSPPHSSSSRKSTISPESDLDRIELCGSPHEEIQQLHLHFIDMIAEVEYLKNTINELQNSQEKTDNVLKRKDTNIMKLAKEIKHLKRPKEKTKLNRKTTSEMLTRIYSADRNNSKICPKYEKIVGEQQKATKQKLLKKKQQKDVTTQVEQDSENASTICVYIENPPTDYEDTENEEEKKYIEEEFEKNDSENDGDEKTSTT